MKYVLTPLLGLLATLSLSCAKAEEPKKTSGIADSAVLFPFVMPWDDASKTLVDVSALNPTPAGVNGRITARNSHFYDGKGRRARFLAVNIVATACFPEKKLADKIAARMHKFGINLVRLHHMDAPWAKPGTLDFTSGGTRKLDAASLDLLDYFVSKLKENGIFVNVNLHVSRPWTAQDELPDTDKIAFAGKPANYFYPRMIALQKEYAKSLLTHKNPYTDSTYAEDLAVAIVEVTNENTLVGEAWGGGIEKMPAPYRAELQKQWNGWLKKKYENSAGVRRAWTSGDKPLGPNRLLNADFAQGAERWTLELNTAPADAKLSLPENEKAPDGVKGGVLRINVTTIGSQNWHIQFHQTALDLVEGEPYTVSFWAKSDRERPLGLYASLDTGDYHNVGLQSGAVLTKEWKQYTYSFIASKVQKEHNRLTFVLGDSLGTVDLAGIALRPGSETPFPKGVSVEQANFPLGSVSLTSAGVDWLTFLSDTERHFMGEMRDYLKKELGVKAMLSGSQANFGGLAGAYRESEFDFVDAHAYWQHPDFPRKQWDMTDWKINNSSLVKATDGGTLSELARARVAGKPYSISEYSHPAPNDYQAECVPMLVAFAALQDWDALYLFDYNDDRDLYTIDRIKGFFSVHSNPAKMALLPAAALLFLRNDMALANNELRLKVAPESVAKQMAKDGPWNFNVWETAGLRKTEAFNNRLSLAFVAGKKPEGDPRPMPPPLNAANLKSPVTWEPSAEKPLFLADSPYSKVILGFLGGQDAGLPGWAVRMAETARNFAVLTLSAVDGKPIEQSKSLLLTAVGAVENKGMVWNSERNSVGDRWGTGPTMAEGIPATIALRLTATTAIVYALDGTGKRGRKVESKLTEGTLTFAIGPEHQTLWYEIAAE